jgi:hypothetical protein
MKSQRDDDSIEPNTSHHNQPKSPGSDCDHTHEEEILKDKRRIWEELHNGGRNPKSVK